MGIKMNLNEMGCADSSGLRLGEIAGSLSRRP